MKREKQNLILAIDFNGTICELSFPEVGKMIPEADIYINRLYDEGHEIVINTCRSGIMEGLAETFMKEKGIHYHYFNSNMPHLIEQYRQDCRKISADLYIDDKCLMGLPDTWEEIYNIIQEKKKQILG